MSVDKIEIDNKGINNSAVSTNVYINVSSHNLIRFVGFPILDVTVYGRRDEVECLIGFFDSDDKRHCSIIAPSCFGKTFVIKKFLQNVNKNDESFKDSFDKIIYFNCRETTDVVSIAENFATCLNNNQLNPANLFSAIQAEKILCIFDNFEDWNNTENQEIIAFLHNIFATNNQLRTILVSQVSVSDRNIRTHIWDLTEIKDSLFKGLDKQSALEFIRAEAVRKNVKLENPDEELDAFFQNVYYIPQAIRSLVDYLDLKKRSFADFMKTYQAEFEAFEKSENRFTKNYNDELRPTLYMIKLQIEAQDEKSKNLLSVLSFFEGNVPQILIQTFSEQVDVTETETIHLLTNNKLVEETKIFRGKDFYYYSPHSVIKDITKEVLPKFEDKYSEILEQLAKDLFNQAFSNQNNQHNYEESISLYECVEKLFDYLITYKSRTELANDLAKAYLNKGVALKNLGKLTEAITEFNKTISIREDLIENQGRGELANELAIAYMNKGVSLRNLGKLTEAIAEYDKAISIREDLVRNQSRPEFANALAMAYMNKGVSLANSERLPDAIVEFDKAISIREDLIGNQGRNELANDLAMVYMNKGNALDQSNSFGEAVVMFSEAINLWESDLLNGFVHKLPSLVKALWIRVKSLIKLEKWSEIASDAFKSLSLFAHFTRDENISEHFKQQIGGEFYQMIYQISLLSNDDREKIFAAADEIGQMSDEKTPFGDILRKYVEQIGE